MFTSSTLHSTEMAVLVLVANMSQLSTQKIIEKTKESSS